LRRALAVKEKAIDPAETAKLRFRDESGPAEASLSLTSPADQATMNA
jgi:hypothetical protein